MQRERERERERERMPHLTFLENQAEYLRLKAVYKEREFNRMSGRATVHQIGIDVWDVGYSGLISKASFCDLRGDVIKATHGAVTMLLRMDKAITIITPEAPEVAYKSNTAPGVVIVRDDQYQVWAEYARLMARVGVIRAVVLQHELPLAHQLMECFSGQRLPALHRMH